MDCLDWAQSYYLITSYSWFNMAQIILIEPDKVLADIYRQGLQAENHQVVICASAQAAIFAADEIRPAIIIMEMQLIGHSGIEFLYEFRSYTEWQAIPVLIHSQVPPSEFQDAWSLLKDELGIEGYLYKPTTNFATLARSVRVVLDAIPSSV